MAAITLQIAAALLFVIAVFAILSRRINDGILGKLCWSFLALSGFSILFANNPFAECSRNVIAIVLVIAVLVVREVGLKIISTLRSHNGTNQR